MLGYFKKWSDIVFRVLMVFGMVSFLFVIFRFYYDKRGVCLPHQYEILEQFVTDVITLDIDKLKEKRAFVEYEIMSEKGMTTYKNKEEILKACKKDFDYLGNASIIGIETSNQCYQANYYIKFKNKSIYVIKVANISKPSFFCICPAYEVVSVEKLAGCGM